MNKAMPSVAQEWEDFAKTSLPGIAATTSMYRDMRASFYAGAWVILRNMLRAADLTEDQGADVLASWTKEVRSFFNTNYPGSMR